MIDSQVPAASQRAFRTRLRHLSNITAESTFVTFCHTLRSVPLPTSTHSPAYHSGRTGAAASALSTSAVEHGSGGANRTQSLGRQIKFDGRRRGCGGTESRAPCHPTPPSRRASGHRFAVNGPVYERCENLEHFGPLSVRYSSKRNSQTDCAPKVSYRMIRYQSADPTNDRRQLIKHDKTRPENPFIDVR